MPAGELHLDGQSLTPLPECLRRGLLAISILASTSFLVTTGLFIYLTVKLSIWYLVPVPDQAAERSPRRPESRQKTRFTMSVDGIFKADDASRSDDVVHVRRQPNQFLLLIYNLLLADMHQALAFALNGTWLAEDGIFIQHRACFTQGLFVSTGDLSSSMFMTFIAAHTYFAIVRGYLMPQWLLYCGIACVWTFVYLISTIPILVTRHGADVGGFFVRAGAWCWMNEEYENLRLLTHYLFIFIALATTSALYVSIFVHVSRKNRSEEGGCSHYPAFLVYPVIYVCCTLPLALGRISTMAGANVPLEYMAFAGAIISFNGFFDCLLFGTTRNSILFSAAVDSEDVGLDTIATLRTPHARRYGNMIWIQGGGRGDSSSQRVTRAMGKRWPWQRIRIGAGPDEEGLESATGRNDSQQSLKQAIQMDIMTTVEVEHDTSGVYSVPGRAGSSVGTQESIPTPIYPKI